jgi:putative spermidine/putrescine transport system ATP-binding protein
MQQRETSLPAPTEQGGPEGFVRFVDVQKTFDGEILVVRDLNLDIRQGEFLTMLGPSGSGKTTTLMMLAGFEVPTRGDISLQGKSIKDLPPHKRDIGVVFQNYALFPHMTVEENVGFPLLARRRPKAEIATRAAAALEMVQLGGFGKRRPQELSGGQQQRVALARALVFEPNLVLMDEPLGALDKQLREHMQLEIKHLHARLGITIVYVTHDQDEALTMSDRIAVFSNGRIQQLATPRQLYEEPANAFVAGFIGENNQLAGTVVAAEAGGCRIRTSEGSEVGATAVDPLAAGLGALLSIRPESVAIGLRATGRQNRMPARLLELIYHGDHVRLRTAIGGSQDFMIKVPRSEIDGVPNPGETVTIGWDRRDCRAFLAG